MQSTAVNRIGHLEKPDLWNFRAHLLNIKISKFYPKIKFQIEANDFIVKTATTQEELREVLSLRHEIFIQEGLGETRFGAIDFDKFDLLGDHILLIDKSTMQVVGTYRILSTGFCKQFYSEREFNLDDFMATPGLKLELGRACIKKEYRRGMAIHLIWKGLGRYAALTGADTMFGCTSLKVTTKEQAKTIIQYLQPEHHSDQFHVRPRLRYQYQFYPTSVKYSHPTPDDIGELIPTLLKSYLKAGAKVYGKPAYDHEFKCSDFFTILDLKALPEKYLKKYLQL